MAFGKKYVKNSHFLGGGGKFVKPPIDGSKKIRYNKKAVILAEEAAAA